MALDHNTFLTHFNGGSVTVDAAAPNFNIVTVNGATAGGNVYGPAAAFTGDIHVVEFRRNVIAAGWWDDDGTDAASNLYLLYDVAPADVTFSTSSWTYQEPQLVGRYIQIEFREIASRTPRIRLPDTGDVEMTVVTPFSAIDFDGTALNTLVIDWSVAGEVTFTLTSESGAEFTLTSATTATTAEVVAEPSFVWHLHDYGSGNEETISDFDIKPDIDPFTTFESDNKFNLSWSAETGADTHELVVNGGPQVFAGFVFGDDPQVELLLPFDDFVDRSGNNVVVTTYGDAQIKTDDSKFYGSSLYLDGSGDYIRFEEALQNHTSVDTPFTIEFWAKIYNNDWGFLGINSAANGSNILILNPSSSFSTALPLNQWLHFCIESDGLGVTLFTDGETNGTRGLPGTPFSDCVAAIGTEFDSANGGSPGNYVSMHVNDLRVTIGRARYGRQPFTPPGQLV